MTKKQLIQALELLEEDDELQAVYKGKYTSEIDSWVTGVKIIFNSESPKVVILVNEVDSNNIFEAA